MYLKNVIQNRGNFGAIFLKKLWANLKKPAEVE